MSVRRESLGALAALAALACGPTGGPPRMGELTDQVIAVNQELVLIVTASDADGDPLDFSFEADVVDIQRRARLGRLPNGAAEFRWTPLAADVGVWPFDFTVSDGTHEDTVTIMIDVRSAIGDGSAPRFLHPAGMGTTLNLGNASCLELDVEVLDADSPEVVIGLGEPVLDGAELIQLTGTTGEFRWCPSDIQVAVDDRYPVIFTADDGDNPVAHHPYLIVLRRPVKPDCPGDPPVISHLPVDENTLLGLTIAAEVSDDQGLKREPLLYWSTSAPAAVPDLGAMNQVPMLLVEGTMRRGTWAAEVPNPVAGLAAGQSRAVHYVIVATDDDDPVGSCDNVGQAPATGGFAMQVRNPGGEGGALACTRCTHDVQCGGSADNCVAQGTAGDAFCLQACSATGGCPSGFTCSPTALTSVNGKSARQCVPSAGQCNLTSCIDDAREDNDSRAQADARPALATGSHSLISCPSPGGTGDDEDWFKIVLTGQATVALTLSGGSNTDLDLALYDAAGQLLASSVSFSSMEEVSRCLPAGTYYVRVFAWGTGRNPYTLSYQRTAGACPAACEADDNEDDDGPAQARPVSIRPTAHIATTQSICPGDDDWYRIQLVNGERLTVDLTFEQSASNEDLDIHLHSASGVDLTPCTAEAPDLCNLANGQSGDSNERFTFQAPASGCAAGCTFFVVVRGFDGSANLYDIRIQGALP
jgi:hypothetical protein